MVQLESYDHGYGPIIQANRRADNRQEHFSGETPQAQGDFDKRDLFLCEGRLQPSKGYKKPPSSGVGRADLAPQVGDVSGYACLTVENSRTDNQYAGAGRYDLRNIV